METPLDVLSTLAASMVENTEKTGESLLGSTCPATAGLDTGSYELAAAAAAAAATASAGSKELPTRTLKADRLKERQELAQVLHMDKDHAASLCAARKTVVTAGTQTQFSSFNGEAPPAPPYPGPPPGPPPAYFAPRGGDDHAADSYSHHPLYGPPPPLPAAPHTSPMSSSSPSASSHLVDLSHAHVASSSDIQNAPLNLSLSNSPLPPVSLPSSSSSSTAWQPHRTSVITCMSSSSSPVSSGGSSPHAHNGHGAHSGRASPSCSSHPVSDPAIEEHFRRSLASYGDSVPKTTASSASSQESNVSITGSVDDHFAKALGDSTWKALKSHSDLAPEIFTGSVDDHFAKALGATTWRRIKAETEHSENSSTAVHNCNPTTASNSTTSNSPGHTSSSSSPSHSGTSLSAPVTS
ncbi:uncharacterized protein LOC143284529 isoform X2 [Babylonia areolata]|uniref:uncharacterized protein LOC143284529 isoform X2 n=1 Tax=Babylonia areolata TaxID=304850 RepID=UPI003FD4CA73